MSPLGVSPVEGNFAPWLLQTIISTVWSHSVLISEPKSLQILGEVVVETITIKIHALFELSYAWWLLPAFIV